MLSEKYNPKIDQEKRKKTFSKLNMEEVNLLHSSDNPEYLAKEFDRIFLKLLRLIRYSSDRNKETKSQIHKDTNNLLKKFKNYVKNKAIDLKSMNEQEWFFRDICMFLNFFEWDSYFTKVHNGIWPTSLREYNNKSVWEQMFHNMYGRERWISKSCEGGSCSYWTILLYNFFNKLKEAWLDLDIKLFRYKNLEDKIIDFPAMRHSWLVITFQWEDYFVDHEGIELAQRKEPIARRIQPYVDVAKKDIKNDEIKEFFENFKHENMKETDQVIFFDDVDKFIDHVEEFPWYKKIALYVKVEDRVDPVKFVYIFTDTWVQIWVNDRWYDYVLKDNKLGRKDFIKNFMKKIWIKRDITWPHYINKDEMEDFEDFMDIVKDKINLDKLHDSYTSGNKWKSDVVERDWKGKIIITPES